MAALLQLGLGSPATDWILALASFWSNVVAYYSTFIIMFMFCGRHIPISPSTRYVQRVLNVRAQRDVSYVCSACRYEIDNPVAVYALKESYWLSRCLFAFVPTHDVSRDDIGQLRLRLVF